MLNQIIMENNQSSINIIKRLYSHLHSKRKRELFILLFLSIFSSLAEAMSIAILIPFISIFISPDTYLLNDSLKFFFDIFNINNSNDFLGAVSFIFIAIVILSSFIKIKFVHLSNRIFTGPLEKFTRMMYSSSYSIMLKHRDHNIILFKQNDNIAYFFVELKDQEENKYRIQWIVEKVTNQREFANCWMTTSVSQPKLLEKSL